MKKTAHVDGRAKGFSPLPLISGLMALLTLALLTGTGLACGSAEREGEGEAADSYVERAREFRALVARGDYTAARERMSEDPRRWWGSREGPGDPWTVGPDGNNPWAAWDDHFESTNEVLEWREGEASARVIIRETNDYFRLLERGWVTNEQTYYFDAAGLIEGWSIRGVGERPPGKTDAFVAWARTHEPEELEALMPGGEIDPAGDHPERFRRLLNRWRQASGLPMIE
jgi:hypothetical protein